MCENNLILNITNTLRKSEREANTFLHHKLIKFNVLYTINRSKQFNKKKQHKHLLY